MGIWLSNAQVNSAVWITIFLIIPFLFNNFNVRRYGEIEYWLTVIKLVTIFGIIILGILLPMSASSQTPLLCTENNHPVQCVNPAVDNGVGPPGFGCTSNMDWLT